MKASGGQNSKVKWKKKLQATRDDREKAVQQSPGPLASGQSFPSFDVSPPGSDAYGLFKGISARFVASFR